jgi:uncharacterized protein YjbI with pentapeptide repeats
MLFLWLPSQSEMTNGIVISIAGAVAITLLALTLTWQGSRAQTLPGIFLSVGSFALLISLFTAAVTWFLSRNSPLASLVWGGLTFAVCSICAVFLLWAGVIAFRSAIFGVITICIAIAIFFGLNWAAYGRSELISYNVAVSIMFAGLSLMGLILALALAITVAFSIAIVWAESGAQRLAMIWTSALIAILIALTTAAAIATKWPFVTIAGTVILALATFQLGMYIGWQAISGDPRFAAIRQAALAIAALSGTNFWGADLSGANFTQATLKNVNFKQANLTHAQWLRSGKIQLAYGGDSYLQSPQIQPLLTTGKGQEQNFDHLNLEGINLRRANLTGASFVGTNLQEADLRQADLSGARLIETQLDGANLAGATLTRIYLHNCQFTTATALEGVECEYLYTTPDGSSSQTLEFNRKIQFRPGGFSRFVRNLASQTQLSGAEKS